MATVLLKSDISGTPRTTGEINSGGSQSIHSPLPFRNQDLAAKSQELVASFFAAVLPLGMPRMQEMSECVL